ncbi:MAG: UDP-glucose dehydrogenase family protein [Solirubrobacteraceae bacterium]
MTSAAGLAALGHRVRVVEAAPDRLATLERGEMPIVEPGLSELVDEMRSQGRLEFTSEMSAVAGASVAFLCVGTPPRADGDPDLRQLAAAAAGVAAHATGDLVAVVKSTVPPGTCDAIQLICEEHAPDGVRVTVASNPEFLRESRALEDFMHPDRIVVGGPAPASALVRELYPDEWRVLVTDRRSAELIKYASNTFLAIKISYANEIAALCEHVGADATAVLEGTGLDPRVGSQFLKPGPGFGGSCLGKDLSGLIAVADGVGLEARVARAARTVNGWARARVVEKLERAIGELEGKHVAVLGLAFKPGTDDVRDSPALDVIAALTQRGARVTATDPLAAPVDPAIERFDDPYDAALGADAVAVLTAWPEFEALDPLVLERVMRGGAVVDAVGVIDTARFTAAGFEVLGVDRGTPGEFHPVILRPLEWTLS